MRLRRRKELISRQTGVQIWKSELEGRMWETTVWAPKRLKKTGRCTAIPCQKVKLKGESVDFGTQTCFIAAEPLSSRFSYFFTFSSCRLSFTGGKWLSSQTLMCETYKQEVKGGSSYFSIFAAFSIGERFSTGAFLFIHCGASILAVTNLLSGASEGCFWKDVDDFSLFSISPRGARQVWGNSCHSHVVTYWLLVKDLPVSICDVWVSPSHCLSTYCLLPLNHGSPTSWLRTRLRTWYWFASGTASVTATHSALVPKPDTGTLSRHRTRWW